MGSFGATFNVLQGHHSSALLVPGGIPLPTSGSRNQAAFEPMRGLSFGTERGNQHPGTGLRFPVFKAFPASFLGCLSQRIPDTRAIIPSLKQRVPTGRSPLRCVLNSTILSFCLVNFTRLGTSPASSEKVRQTLLTSYFSAICWWSK